jgi:hypothetical protein
LDAGRLNRDRVLAASRRLGWLSAAAVVASCAFGVWAGVHAMQDRRAVGKAEARAFIEKVRACHRAPKPHPSWTECERLEQDRE